MAHSLAARLQRVDGLPTLEQHLYMRGINERHFLFPFVKSVWCDATDITNLGVVWLSPLDDLALVLRPRPGAPPTMIERGPALHEHCGYMRLVIGNGILSAVAVQQIIDNFPVLAGHLHPETISPSADPWGASHGA